MFIVVNQYSSVQNKRRFLLLMVVWRSKLEFFVLFYFIDLYSNFKILLCVFFIIILYYKDDNKYWLFIALCTQFLLFNTIIIKL